MSGFSFITHSRFGTVIKCWKVVKKTHCGIDKNDSLRYTRLFSHTLHNKLPHQFI